MDAQKEHFKNSRYVFTTREEYEAWIERMKNSFDYEEAVKYGYDPEALRKSI